MGAEPNAEFPRSFCHVVVAVVGRGIQSNHIQFAAELRLIIKDARERTRQLAASTRAGNEQPGQSRDRALEEAGINRDEVYVTNAVKHFKWEPRGKRRIHQKPSSRDIAACRPWLEAELRLVEPKLVVCLGSTAGQTIFGPSFRVTKERGKVLSSRFAQKVVATVHPSSLLRQPDEESREREYKNFVSDLRVAVKAAEAK